MCVCATCSTAEERPKGKKTTRPNNTLLHVYAIWIRASRRVRRRQWTRRQQPGGPTVDAECGPPSTFGRDSETHHSTTPLFWKWQTWEKILCRGVSRPLEARQTSASAALAPWPGCLGQLTLAADAVDNCGVTGSDSSPVIGRASYDGRDALCSRPLSKTVGPSGVPMACICLTVIVCVPILNARCQQRSGSKNKNSVKRFH